MARWSAGPWNGGSRDARKHCGTASGGHLPWIGVNDSAEEQRLQADHAARLQESANFQLGGLAKLTGAHDPRHALQKSGGLADPWHMDDGDVMCHPILVLPFLQNFDVANASVGAKRNPCEWSGCSATRVRSVAKTSAATASSITLGVAVGSRQFVADELLSKADVIRAMHGRVQLCQDPQTESPCSKRESGS